MQLKNERRFRNALDHSSRLQLLVGYHWCAEFLLLRLKDEVWRSRLGRVVEVAREWFRVPVSGSAVFAAFRKRHRGRTHTGVNEGRDRQGSIYLEGFQNALDILVSFRPVNSLRSHESQWHITPQSANCVLFNSSVFNFHYFQACRALGHRVCKCR